MNVFEELAFDGLSFVSSIAPVICYRLTRENESQSSLHISLTFGRAAANSTVGTTAAVYW